MNYKTNTITLRDYEESANFQLKILHQVHIYKHRPYTGGGGAGLRLKKYQQISLIVFGLWDHITLPHIKPNRIALLYLTSLCLCNTLVIWNLHVLYHFTLHCCTLPCITAIITASPYQTKFHLLHIPLDITRPCHFLLNQLRIC